MINSSDSDKCLMDGFHIVMFLFLMNYIWGWCGCTLISSLARYCLEYLIPAICGWQPKCSEKSALAWAKGQTGDSLHWGKNTGGKAPETSRPEHSIVPTAAVRAVCISVHVFFFFQFFLSKVPLLHFKSARAFLHCLSVFSQLQIRKSGTGRRNLDR